MAILNAADLNLIHALLDGEDVGTLFLAHDTEGFDTVEFITSKEYLQ